MKVELIIPPNPYLGDDKRNPPLGLLYIASVTEKEGHDIRIADLRGGKNIDDFVNQIGIADVYGITASTPDYFLASEIAKAAKLKNKGALVVLGGIHGTSVPYDIGEEFEKVIIGEGEISFLKILEDFKNKKNSHRFYKSDSIKELDSIPFPARHLLPFDSVFSQNALVVGGEPAATIITSRGCPYSCSFCASESMWGGKVRFRSPDNIISELKEVIERYNVKNFRFQDDTMTLKKTRLEEICKKIKELDIKWRTTTRVDQAELEILRMIKEAGCEEVGYGIESLSQEVLDRVSKKIKLSDVYTALENTKKAGLKSRVFLIIGLPGEKVGFADRLENFIKKVKPDGIDVSTLVPYPGSRLYKEPESFGISINLGDFSRYHMTLGLREGEVDRPFLFKHDIMSEKQLMEERRKSLEIIKAYKLIKNF